eukprot:jgi/Mesvir1/22568/Mv18572-RA.1
MPVDSLAPAPAPLQLNVRVPAGDPFRACGVCTRPAPPPFRLAPAQMATSEGFSSLIPSGLYFSKNAQASLEKTVQAPTATTAFAAASPSEDGVRQRFLQGINIPAPKEGIKMYSPEFYAACTFGGILSCGLTHTMVTPLDVVKCNMQTDPGKYRSIASGFSIVAKEQGLKGLVKGWVPTLIGYSMQGACKFGFYEFFKKYYADLAGPEAAEKYKTLIYLAGSASAEVIADIALAPMEAVKVQVQTKPGFAKGLADGLPKVLAAEGYSGLYKGLRPLWGRQIPYTMMKFACFEKTVEALYQYVVPIPRAQCTKPTQLGVSFAAGYIAGVFCAVVSHPADNLVSKLNAKAGSTMGEIIKEMGMVQLFTRGLPLRIVMIGTLTGLQWGIYDAFKVYVGLPTTGAKAPEPSK